MKPEGYMIGAKELKNNRTADTNGSHSAQQCVGTVRGKYYSVFDNGIGSIGFAQKV